MRRIETFARPFQAIAKPTSIFTPLVRFAFIVVALAGSAASARADDAQEIVGVWVPTSLESNGTVYTLEQLKPIAAQLTFTITPDKITVPVNGSTEIGYDLGPGADPKTIDTVDRNGSHKGELRKGIYELRGDTLKLCMAAKDAPRPQGFSTKPGADGGGERVITFQRKK